MYLVDSQIKQLGSKVITSHFDEARIGPVSYDVSVDYIIDHNREADHYLLPPHEFVFIATEEEIHVPDDMLISVGNKNSLLRLGLTVDGPKYFPGHETKMFLRVRNDAAYPIEITRGMVIAQLFYEQLAAVPERTYAQREDVSFQNETTYRGIQKKVSV